MKTTLFATLMCLTMGMSVPSLHAADKAASKDTTVVIARGVSINAEKALRSALRNAVEKVVGVIIDAETLIKNEKVVKDEILDFSNGFVEKFEKLKEGKNDDGLYEVTIKATVKRRQLIERLQKTKVYTGKVSGGSLFGSVLSELESNQKGAALLKKTLKDLNLPHSLLKAEAVNSEPKVLKKEADSIQAEWIIRIQYDQDRYRKVVLPKLKQVLGDIAIGKKIKDPLLHNVKLEHASWPFGKSTGWNKYGVYQYLFDDGNVGQYNWKRASFAGQLPRVVSKREKANGIQSKNKPVAGGVPVFLLEGWQPLTGQQTYRVYWVDLESAKVLAEYFTAYSDLKVELRGGDKRVLFGKTFPFRARGYVRGHKGVIMSAPGTRMPTATILYPTLIYAGRSEFVDESSLVGINADRFSLVPGHHGRRVNTISIMPLMHLVNGDLPGHEGVAEVVNHSWQPVIPLAIIKDVTQISCSFVNAGKP